MKRFFAVALTSLGVLLLVVIGGRVSTFGHRVTTPPQPLWVTLFQIAPCAGMIWFGQRLAGWNKMEHWGRYVAITVGIFATLYIIGLMYDVFK